MVWLRLIRNLLLLVFAGCSSVNSVEGILQPVVDETSLDSALEKLVEAGVAPGITIAVVKNGLPVYLKGFGDADATQSNPVRADSAFNLWSVSKVFTQLAIHDLVERGVVHLDDPICEYIEWLQARECKPTKEAASRTISTLMDHTAGIPDIGLKLYGETQFDSDEIPSQKTLAIRLIGKKGRWSEAGIESRYSNSHYLLLAAIVEHVSGQTFPDFVQTRVLAPLELKNTGYRYIPELQIMSGSHPVDLTSFFAFFYVDKTRAVRARLNGRYWFNTVYNSSLGSTGMVSNGSGWLVLAICRSTS